MATASYPVFTLPTPASDTQGKVSARWGPTIKAYAALGLGIVFIAWSAILVKWANVPGPSSAFYRVFFASVILVPALLIRSRLRRRQPETVGSGSAAPSGSLSAVPSVAQGLSWKHIGLGVIAGVLFALDLALYNTSILMTSAANATLLGNNAPIMVALGAWAMFGSRPSKIFWAGLAIASAGTLVIVGGDLLAHPHLGLGDLYAILASVCYAAYLMAVARVRSKSDTLTLVTLTVTASTVTLFIITLVLQMPLSGFSTTAWMSLVGLGLIAQLGGYLAITYALGHLSPTLTSICLLVQAPLTALLAVPMLGEPISSTQILGGTLVLGGIYIVNHYAESRSVSQEKV